MPKVPDLKVVTSFSCNIKSRSGIYLDIQNLKDHFFVYIKSKSFDECNLSGKEITVEKRVQPPVKRVEKASIYICEEGNGLIF